MCVGRLLLAEQQVSSLDSGETITYATSCRTPAWNPFLLHLKAERGTKATTILEFAPAEAAQVDFGAGPVLTHHCGIAIKTWIFVMTLCWSRHQYAEIVLDQMVQTWLACHRHAFECEWGDAFPDNRILGAATLDRLRHGAYRIVIEGESFRKPKPMLEYGENALAKSSKKPHS
ncbi:hypothetical protein DFQ28_001162 [Apophysomyces sp. BC1034]|nr:hypothetical protein DFQ30_010001 [Apophysomyces sp. BC1015]KAG0183718.1 hypothetical protein DFQ28_001162 [Apophysomyces sp. BC1034]